jgi:hypothetical protein
MGARVAQKVGFKTRTMGEDELQVAKKVGFWESFHIMRIG